MWCMCCLQFTNLPCPVFWYYWWKKIKKHKRRAVSCGMTFIRVMKIHQIVQSYWEIHTHKHIYACTHPWIWNKTTILWLVQTHRMSTKKKRHAYKHIYFFLQRVDSRLKSTENKECIQTPNFIYVQLSIFANLQVATFHMWLSSLMVLFQLLK